MSERGYLLLESGEKFLGHWHGGRARAAEVVFNTSHSGYEEIATDPSYFSQMVVMTAPMQGNYGVSDDFWESRHLWINGFISLELQQSTRDSFWIQRLVDSGIPVLSGIDTRALVLHLRERGTCWGALLPAASTDEEGRKLMREAQGKDRDWVHQVTVKSPQKVQGDKPGGPRVALLDYGYKANILRELKSRSSEVMIFPSRSSSAEIRAWGPDGIVLSNGPGDPGDVQVAVETVRELLGWRFMFGICMGQQIMALALGGSTFKLKFGHRGSNHPVQDHVLKRIYVTSQNHGYGVIQDSLPKGVGITHTNLNDGTVAGIYAADRKCMAVQFHPESHPGPHDAVGLFDFFVKQLQ